jgi:glycosyltransferase involved in cell wall biosynthesis
VSVLATSAETPLLSLIVCTRNRSARLQDFVQALGRMRCSATWELVLVDNGSSDDTAERVRGLASQVQAPVTIVDEPRPGLGRARNAGVRRARGSILVFTDDDCYPAADYLDRIADAFADSGLDYLGGRILLHDSSDYPITIRVDPLPSAIPPRSVVPAGLIQGANMAFRRRVLESLGGFDDELGPGTPFCNDDVDAVARASAAGFTGSYLPEPTVYHHHRRRAQADIDALWRTYDRGRGAYYAKCILDLPTRRGVARHWWQSARAAAPRATLREIEGAIDYCLRRATRHFG